MQTFQQTRGRESLVPCEMWCFIIKLLNYFYMKHFFLNKKSKLIAYFQKNIQRNIMTPCHVVTPRHHTKVPFLLKHTLEIEFGPVQFS